MTKMSIRGESRIHYRELDDVLNIWGQAGYALVSTHENPDGFWTVFFQKAVEE